MVRPMPSSAPAPARVRNRFRAKAQAFDDLYEDERPLARRLRPGLFRRRELASETVAAYAVAARAGRRLRLRAASASSCCDAGAARYLGIDFSEPMIELARARLRALRASGPS